MRTYPYAVTVANRTRTVYAFTAREAAKIAMERWGTTPDTVERIKED